MREKKRIKEWLLLVFIAVLVTVIVGGSLAYWTQELHVENEFQLGRYNLNIIEDFESPNNWMPGIDVNKDVSLINEGNVPAVIKVIVNLDWIRTENVYSPDGEVVSPAAGESFDLTFDADGSGRMEYAALINWGKDVVLLSPGASSSPSGRALQPLGALGVSGGISFASAGPTRDGVSLASGLPVVGTLKDAEGKWVLLNEAPNANNNLVFYYIGVLEPGEITPLLVDSVTMNPQIKATVLESSTTYNKELAEWETEYIFNGTSSYENAKFTLTVTAVTVQATEDAVKEVFVSNTLLEQNIVSYLSQMKKEFDVAADAGMEKKLYFEPVNGVMTFTPVRNGSDHWFMSFLNMVPGGTYNDTMVIENHSSKNYNLYMQAVPLPQQQMPHELLEQITMRVYHDGTLVYDGTAMGCEYPGSVCNLQDVINLGEYTAGASNRIEVELAIPSDMGQEYSAMLTKINWKFMVEEMPDGGGTQSPQTGDTIKLVLYIILMAASVFALVVCVYCLHKREKQRREKEQG